jgi:hypothetical protein
MLLELGPLPADDLGRWSRFARRVVVELRSNPDDLQGIATDDFLTHWSSLLDALTSACATASCGDVRWSCPIDDELAEFLVHGLERCFYSEGVTALMAPEDLPGQRQITLHIIQAFVNGLAAQGNGYDHYADQVRASFGGYLE